MTTTKLRCAALLVALALVASGCGARLTEQQVTAVKAGQATNGSSGFPTDDTTPDDGGTATDDTTPGSSGGTGGGSSGGGSTRTTLAGSGPVAAGVNPHVAPAGGNGGATDVGVTATSITLGNVATLTGPVPGLFAGATVGAQAVVAYENSLGGLWGRKFKLDARDDQFDSGQHRSQTGDLITKSLAMLGTVLALRRRRRRADEGGEHSRRRPFARLRTPEDPQQLLDSTVGAWRPNLVFQLLQATQPQRHQGRRQHLLRHPVRGGVAARLCEGGRVRRLQVHLPTRHRRDRDRLHLRRRAHARQRREDWCSSFRSTTRASPASPRP